MYLMIRNPGTTDFRALTLLGVSTTRTESRAGSLGFFGSGSKNSLSLLLRHDIRPIIYTGNLKMEVFAKPLNIKGNTYNQVCVKYSGKDENEKTKNTTEDLGFATEWGTQDWTNLGMALREFVSNAIDGSLSQGKTHNAVEFDIVDKPRAKAGHTSVYLPYTTEIEKAYKELNTTFLHFRAPELLKQKLLPKTDPEQILIYKKGVLVCQMKGKSVFDYNLDDALRLDECRNASIYDVQWVVGKNLRDATSTQLAKIIKAVSTDPQVWEGKLSPAYLQTDSWDKEDKEKRKKIFQQAWQMVAGDKIACRTPHLADFISKKGFQSFNFQHDNWYSVLESYEIPTETTVLSKQEQDGKSTTAPTTDMLEAVDWVWALLTKHNLTNNKNKPETKGFESIMSAGAQQNGEYANNTVYLHKNLGGLDLKKVALEECVHHVTQAGDLSRDLQDYLFRLVVLMAT